MKANAPENIYVSNYSSGLTYNWHNERLAVNDIEYVRKDVFIEKAAEYLSYHLDTNKIDVNYKFDFIEEFKKVMKGK